MSAQGPVAIYGAGGQARVVAATLLAQGVEIAGFFDDSFHGPETIFDRPVLGRFADIVGYHNDLSAVYLAIGDNGGRRRAYDFLNQQGFSLPALIHPTALVAANVVIAEAALICMGVILVAGVRIGRGAIINTGCSVDHESRIGDFVHLAPKSVVAGRVTIGDNTFVGVNAAIGDRLTIGTDVIIGAGSIILADVPNRAKVTGVHHRP